MSRAEVVRIAQSWLGTPYRHRASLKGAGCDCLGLLRGVWRELYGTGEPMPVPPYRADMRDPALAGALEAAAWRHLVPAPGALEAGQVVLFRLAGLPHAAHCAILLGPERFVHAQERLGVVEAGLSTAWARRVSRRFDFPDLD